VQCDLHRAGPGQLDEILAAFDFLDRRSRNEYKVNISRQPGPAEPVFAKGDEVVIVKGTYTGTPGVFLQFRADIKWADITERNGTVRSHPLEWLTHA
jgi:hypothetical protein